ncbi:MAG: TSUP family transporter, partial [bacterium]
LRRRPKPADGERALNVTAAMLSGAVIGLLGGFVGLILGSLRMPALLRLVGETPARAVGTNLLVGVCVGIAGLIGHLPSAAPDAGILAVGAAQPNAVVRNGQITTATTMQVTISADHRVTDGAEAAQFLGEIKRGLENPFLLFLSE